MNVNGVESVIKSAVLRGNGHINDDWLKAVKKSADSYNEPVAEDRLSSGWEKIQKELSQPCLNVSEPRRRSADGRGHIIIWSSLAAAAAVIIALLILPLHKPEEQNALYNIDKQTTAVNNSAGVKSSGVLSPASNSAASSTAANNTAASNTAAKASAAVSSSSIKIRFGLQPSEVKKVAAQDGIRTGLRIDELGNINGVVADKKAESKTIEIKSAENISENKIAENVSENKTDNKSEKIMADNKPADKKNIDNSGSKRGKRVRTFEIGEPVTVSSKGKWTAGLMMADAAGKGRNSGSSAELSASMPMGGGGFFALANTFALSLSPANYSHKQPISFGITVERKFGNNGKFSVESGIVYSLLNSDVESDSYNLRQHLHYIGIPVAAKWNFVNTERFTVYAAAGGMVEKGVAGRMENKENKKLKTGHFSIKGLQLSLAVDAGAEYKIYKNVGIYIQPGVSYYFKPKDMGTFFINSENSGSVGGSSGSGRAFQLESIHSNNRIGLNIQAGIRLSY